MIRPAVRATRNTASKSIDTTLRQSAKLHASAGTQWAMPALLNRRSTVPNAPSTCSNARSTCSSLVTSTRSAWASRPSARILWTISEPSSTSMMKTSAPASASAKAQVAPMPRAPPVTTAFFPVRRNESRMLIKKSPFKNG